MSSVNSSRVGAGRSDVYSAPPPARTNILQIRTATAQCMAAAAATAESRSPAPRRWGLSRLSARGPPCRAPGLEPYSRTAVSHQLSASPRYRSTVGVHLLDGFRPDPQRLAVGAVVAAPERCSDPSWTISTTCDHPPPPQRPVATGWGQSAGQLPGPARGGRGGVGSTPCVACSRRSGVRTARRSRCRAGNGPYRERGGAQGAQGWV